jgi:hypothetical protein
LRHIEHDEQVKFFKYLQQLRVDAASVTFAVPNGARLASLRHAKRIAAEGMKAGVPDIICPVACSGFTGLAIEMKIPPNKSTPKQLQWQKMLRKVGWQVVECHSAVEALRAFAAYNKLETGIYRVLQEVLDE